MWPRTVGTGRGSPRRTKLQGPRAEIRGMEGSEGLPSFPFPGTAPPPLSSMPRPVPQQLPTAPLQHGDTKPPRASLRMLAALGLCQLT